MLYSCPMKICVDCKVSKELSEFPSAGKNAVKTRCKPCYNLYTKNWRENHANKDRLREQWRQASRRNYTTEKSRRGTLAKYGLTEDDYGEMYSAQGGACKICKTSLPVLKVDHCHKGGQVRGLLCNHCNTGLGSFRDNVTFLANAIQYLNDAE